MTTLLTLAPAVLSVLNSGPKMTSMEQMMAYAGNSEQISMMNDASMASSVEFETEEAPDGSFCYVDEETGEALSKVGFPVREVKDEDGSVQYGYEVSRGTPKIKAASVKQNDVGELCGRISRLEGDVVAKNILATPNPIPSNIDNTVLGYLRSFNAHYVLDPGGIADALGSNDWWKTMKRELGLGVAWSAVSGTVDSNYTKPQDLVLYNWKFIYRYFSQFVDRANWSAFYHNGYCGPSNGKGINFTDPMGHGVDLIHLFASIDGGYKLTGVVGSLGQFITGDQLMNLSSWAGDLQSVAISLNVQDTENFNDPFDVLGAGAEENDLLADIDAVNIVSDHLTGVGFLHDALNNYYGGTMSMAKRCLDFAENVSGFRSMTALENVVYEYLGLEKINGVWQDSAEFLDTSNPMTKGKYLILRGDLYQNKKDASTAKRRKVASAFMKYLRSFTTAVPTW